MKFRFCVCLLAVSILLSLFPPVCVYAQSSAAAATEISSIDLITASTGFGPLKRLFDNKTATPVAAEASASLTLEHEAGIGSLYLIFAKAYGNYTVTNNDTGASTAAGTDPFIHEFVDLVAAFGTAPRSVTISFDNGPVEFTELDIYTPGEVPESVQKWSLPAEGKADLVLFATHSDDDQLFFAGLIPYYVLERGYQVQVVYLTNHHNTAPFRVHEVLNGLWAVGVRCYPVLGEFDDFGDANTLEQGFQKFKQRGFSREELTGFVVEQLRRFKPYVAVGHDFKGEYGHAQHRVYAQLLADAIEISNDPALFPESAEQYGTWDVPKTYIHLYSKNRISMNWDQPMENFGGMTPYEVTKKLGFPAHYSQQKGWGWYFAGKDTAASIKDYSPCKYGLYRTTVGEDVQKNDMFENLTTHTELARQEEAARLEAERLAASLTEPETAPPVSESAATEPEIQTQEVIPSSTPETVPPQPVKPEKETNLTVWFVAEIVLILLLILLIVLSRRNRKRRRR